MDVVKNVTDFACNVTDLASKIAKENPQSTVSETRLMVHSGFDDDLSLKLPTRYKKPSLALGEIGRLWVVDFCQTARYCDTETDDRQIHVAAFLCALLIQESHRTNNLISKQSATFLQDIMGV